MARRTAVFGGGWRQVARGVLVAGALTLALALNGCASGNSSSVNSPTATPIGQGQPTATPVETGGATTPGATATDNIAGSGSLDICQPVTPTPVEVGVPSEVPVYSTGTLKLAEANAASNTSEFGFCIPDSVTNIGNFYAQQLPAKGWSSINTFNNLGTENLTAKRGSESITITISPDTLQQGKCDLLIILQE
jgi:hypothetical protein